MCASPFEANDEIIFLDTETVIAIHEEALIEGGLAGILNLSALESALHRPQNAFDYEGCKNLIRLASVLWHGVSSAHAFCDANKRTALLTCLAFLEVNGLELHSSVHEDEAGNFIECAYKTNTFEIPLLEEFLRVRLVWIEV